MRQLWLTSISSSDVAPARASSGPAEVVGGTALALRWAQHRLWLDEQVAVTVRDDDVVWDGIERCARELGLLLRIFCISDMSMVCQGVE